MFQFIIYSFLDFHLGQFVFDLVEVTPRCEHSLRGIHLVAVAVAGAMVVALVAVT